MTNDLEIRALIAAMVAGELEAEDLEDQILELVWDDAEPTSAFAAAALRLLAEHSNGDWTAEELRTRLGVLGRSYWFELAPKPTAFANSAARITEMELVGSEREAGTQRVAAFV